MASAVLLNRQLFDRIVRWRTVAKVLSMGLRYEVGHLPKQHEAANLLTFKRGRSVSVVSTACPVLNLGLPGLLFGWRIYQLISIKMRQASFERTWHWACCVMAQTKSQPTKATHRVPGWNACCLADPVLTRDRHGAGPAARATKKVNR